MKHFNKCLYESLYKLILLWYLDMCIGEPIRESRQETNDLYLNGALIQIPIQPNRLDQIQHNPQTAYSSFSCQSSGAFEDVSNPNLYWYCNVSPDGGFLAIRRSCPVGYIFNPASHKCISKNEKRGSANCDTKEIENQEAYIVILTEKSTTADDCDTTACLRSTDSPDTECFTTTSTTCSPHQSSFKCKSQGAFPDPNNRNSFYICHSIKTPKKSFEKIKVNCPEGMCFDKKLKWCSRQSRALCENDNYRNIVKVLNALKIDKKRERQRSVHQTIASLHNKIKDGFKNRRKSKNKYRPDPPKYYITKRYADYNDKKLQTVLHFSNDFYCSSGGRFPDPQNQNKYYICYPKKIGSGYITLKMKCPRNTSFDVNRRTCSTTK